MELVPVEIKPFAWSDDQLVDDLVWQGVVLLDNGDFAWGWHDWNADTWRHTKQRWFGRSPQITHWLKGLKCVLNT